MKGEIMTADQMPDELWVGKGADDPSLEFTAIRRDEYGCYTKYIRADLATPPKSQGAGVTDRYTNSDHYTRALIKEARNYMAAVAALGEQTGYNHMNYFEAPILKMPTEEMKYEAFKRWNDLNSTGQALSEACDKAATRQHPTPAQDELIQQAYLMGVLGSTNTPIPDDEKLRNAIIGFPRKADMADERILRWFRKHHEVLKHIMFHKAALSPTPAQAQGEIDEDIAAIIGAFLGRNSIEYDDDMVIDLMENIEEKYTIIKRTE